MVASGVGTLTSALRMFLLKQGNKPAKINMLYDVLRTQDAFKEVTKTFIKRNIIHGMVLRNEVRRSGSKSEPLDRKLFLAYLSY